MISTMKSTKDKTVKITPDTHFELKELARIRGVKFQFLLEKIIRSYFKKIVKE